MLENNPADLGRVEIKRVIGNQYSRLFRPDSRIQMLYRHRKAPPPTADRGEKKRRPRNRLEGNCFNCGRKGHRAGDRRSAKKKIEK